MANPIQNIIKRLTEISAGDFTHERILKCLSDNPVNLECLEPYLYFSSQEYTRNLIHRTRTFELVAVGWKSGQESAIHNHHNQRCWTSAVYGKLMVQNFRVTKRDSSGYCELEPGTSSLIDASTPPARDPEADVHKVSNLEPFDSRAVTLHIYSKPFYRCEVYDLSNRRYCNTTFTNTSEFGVLRPGNKANKLTCSQVRTSGELPE